MNPELLQAAVVHCPYCGESLDVTLDCSVDVQQYIEDCQVCCRPIEFHVSVDEDGLGHVTTRHEDE